MPDAKQTEVLESRSARILLNCCRQWGKSTTTAARAVHQALYRPGTFVLAVSPTVRQTVELFRKMEAMLVRCGVHPRGDGDHPVSLALPEGSRIVGVPAREANIRGYSSVDLLIVDEAARVPDAVYHALRPMLAIRGGAIVLLSTPCGERGFFHAEWTNRLAHWERISVKATDCPRIAPAFLREEYEALGDFWFRQEYLCEFHAAPGQLFTDEMIARAAAPNEKSWF
ncbi:MAG: terminase family protein [Bryobacteraceae bacterium]